MKVNPDPQPGDVPAGYAILQFGGRMWRPVLVVSGGDGGLWARPVYRELSTDGRTGAVCHCRAEALAVIARHQVWRKQEQEIERGRAGGRR